MTRRVTAGVVALALVLVVACPVADARPEVTAAARACRVRPVYYDYLSRWNHLVSRGIPCYASADAADKIIHYKRGLYRRLHHVHRFRFTARPGMGHTRHWRCARGPVGHDNFALIVCRARGGSMSFRIEFGDY